MIERIQDTVSSRELSILSSIIQVGESLYRDLIEDRHPLFAHQYLAEIRGRVRTKLVQMQCEIESREPNFPFTFTQRTFAYNQKIPELYTRNLILHIARSPAPNILPFNAKYKTMLSFNNSMLDRQLKFDYDSQPYVQLEPFYGLLVFGGQEQSFATIQFPEPGYGGIMDHIDIPVTIAITEIDAPEAFKRKKAGLKKEFLSRGIEEEIL